jgi:hypothetical protein
MVRWFAGWHPLQISSVAGYAHRLIDRTDYTYIYVVSGNWPG